MRVLNLYACLGGNGWTVDVIAYIFSHLKQKKITKNDINLNTNLE